MMRAVRATSQPAVELAEGKVAERTIGPPGRMIVRLERKKLSIIFSESPILHEEKEYAQTVEVRANSSRINLNIYLNKF